MHSASVYFLVVVRTAHLVLDTSLFRLGAPGALSAVSRRISICNSRFAGWAVCNAGWWIAAFL